MTVPDLDPRAVTAPQFTEILGFINRGALLEETTVCLAELVQAIRDTGKKGSITLVVDVEPFKGSDETLNVAGRVSVKLPKALAHASVMFTDAKGGLHRDDPNRPQLPFADQQRAERPIA
jgi:hypothetical protein